MDNVKLKIVRFYIKENESIELNINYFEITSRNLKDAITCVLNHTRAARPKSIEFPEDVKYFLEKLEIWGDQIRSAHSNLLMLGNLAIFLPPRKYSSYPQKHLKRESIWGLNRLELGEASIRVLTTYDLEFAMFEDFGAVPVTLFFKFGDKAWFRYRKLLINLANSLGHR